VLTLYKLSEEKAAQAIKELCMDLGKNKISSVGKLLFYATQILKSKEAKAALAPIKQMMAASYEGMDVDANQIVTGSQKYVAYYNHTQLFFLSHSFPNPIYYSIHLTQHVPLFIYCNVWHSGSTFLFPC
jgi:hypothetical protein